MTHDLPRRFVAEFLGTAMLLAAVVGSGIMGERLSGSTIAVALLANSFATGGALFALILCFSSISGAHFNPALTLIRGTGRGRVYCGRLLVYFINLICKSGGNYSAVF